MTAVRSVSLRLGILLAVLGSAVVCCHGAQVVVDGPQTADDGDVKTQQGAWSYRLVDAWGMPAVVNASLRTHGGRLEARRRGSSPDDPWLAVCGDGFDAAKARFACAAVRGTTVFNGHAAFRVSAGPEDAYARAGLHAERPSLVVRRDRGGVAPDDNTACSTPGRDLVLFCYADVPPEARRWQYRLPPGLRGLLEVRPSPESAWGTVCSDRFTIGEAYMACASLGKPHAFPTAEATSTRPSLAPVWMSGTHCKDPAKELGECEVAAHVSADCASHGQDVIIDCASEYREVRLVGIDGKVSASAGHVQLRHNSTGPWHRLCATTSWWTGRAICRTVLGVDSVAGWLTTPAAMGVDPLPTTSARVLMGCSQSTKTIRDCSLNDWREGVGPCATTYVACSRQPPNPSDVRFSARLVGGVTARSGLLEVRPSPDAAWGTVCRAFDQAAAMAACRMLGLDSKVGPPRVWNASSHGVRRAGGPVWMTDIACPPNAAGLGACTHIFAPEAMAACNSHEVDVFLDCGVADATPAVKGGGNSGRADHGGLPILWGGPSWSLCAAAAVWEWCWTDGWNLLFGCN